MVYSQFLSREENDKPSKCENLVNGIRLWSPLSNQASNAKPSDTFFLGQNPYVFGAPKTAETARPLSPQKNAKQ